jgi:Domain of unknown function (DUF1834).
MSQLLQLRESVITQIQAALPTFNVEGHFGRFNGAELTRFLVAAPAIRVAILGLSDSSDGADEDALEAVARIGIYIVTKDGDLKGSRDAAICAAAERIVLLALGQRWGLAFCRPARPAIAQNLYSEDTLAKGVALWAIDLRQPVSLTLPEGTGGGDPEGALTELYIGLAPDIGPAHIDDYIGPLPGQDGPP